MSNTELYLQVEEKLVDLLCYQYKLFDECRSLYVGCGELLSTFHRLDPSDRFETKRLERELNVIYPGPYKQGNAFLFDDAKRTSFCRSFRSGNDWAEMQFASDSLTVIYRSGPELFRVTVAAFDTGIALLGDFPADRALIAFLQSNLHKDVLDPTTLEDMLSKLQTNYDELVKKHRQLITATQASDEEVLTAFLDEYGTQDVSSIPIQIRAYNLSDKG